MRLSIFLFLFLCASATAQTPDVLEFAEVTPVLVGGMEALQRRIVYPEADRAAGTEGRVLVRFVVDAEGVPGQVEVVRSVSAGLDSAAAAAVRDARFTPGMDGGKAVSIRLVLPVTFRISGPEAPAAKPGVAALTAGLGRPCCGVPADSGAVSGGTGTLLWRAPEAGVESLEARVEDDMLREVTIAYPAGAPSPIEALARQIAETRVSPDADGFVLAYDLAGRGMSTAADLRLDASRNRLTLPAPRVPRGRRLRLLRRFPCSRRRHRGASEPDRLPDGRLARRNGRPGHRCIRHPSGRIGDRHPRRLEHGRALAQEAERSPRRRRPRSAGRASSFRPAKARCRSPFPLTFNVR